MSDSDTLDDLEARLIQLATTFRAVQAEMIDLIAEYDLQGGWYRHGALSAAHWLADQMQIELCTAREHVRIGRALRHLPLTRRALLDGDISYSKARELTRLAKPETEEELLEIAVTQPAGSLRREFANWQHTHYPDELMERHQKQRSCQFLQEADGMTTMKLRLPPDEAALIQAQVEAQLRALPRTARQGKAPRRSLQSRRADAATQLLLDAPAGASNANAAPRTEVVVHLRNDKAELPSGLILDDRLQKRLACEADIRAMTHAEDGSPISLGRKHRIVPPTLKKLVFERDKHCRFDGCTTTDFVEVHHVVHWQDGGETNLDNLVLLCSYHHSFTHRSDTPLRM